MRRKGKRRAEVREKENNVRSDIGIFGNISLYLYPQIGNDSFCGMLRRDAGVVDRAALEMRCTGNCT